MLIVIVIAVAYSKAPKSKGRLGEKAVIRVIGPTVPRVRYLINDLKIRLPNGKTAQIDHILINKKGIFVIETKNYSGNIYGNDNQLEWTQVLNYGRVKNKIYNPVKQNKTHVYYISKMLDKRYPIISAVVFVQGNTQYINSDNVYSLSELKELINSGEDILDDAQMKELYNKISAKYDNTITNSEHIKNIATTRHSVERGICPRCGNKLVLRQGRNGKFMGCQNYPNCKFTANIDTH